MSKWIKNTSGTTKIWAGQAVANGDYYNLEAAEEARWANDSNVLADIGSGDLTVARANDGANDISDVSLAVNFLKDIPAAVDADGVPLSRQRAFANADGFRVRFKGISGTATNSTSTNIDYCVLEERYINGIRLILTDHHTDDAINFQIVDVDNVLGYGAGLVLDEFGSTWSIDSTVSTQSDVIVPYPAKIIAGLYIRLVYISAGSVDVKVKANLYLHKKAA